MRDRAWRRKKTESKWNSRCKKFMFDSIISDGKIEYSFKVSNDNSDNGNKKTRCTVIIPNLRKPSTWKEMKKLDPWAKYLKNSSTSRSCISNQIDARKKIKLQRMDNKKLINEGIQEWDDIYDETLEDLFYINNVNDVA